MFKMHTMSLFNYLYYTELFPYNVMSKKHEPDQGKVFKFF